MKPTLVAVIIVILVLVATPTIAAASMDVVDNCDSSPCRDETAVPLCCLTANCPLSNCIITIPVTNEVPIISRSTLNEDVYVAGSQTSVTTDISPPTTKPFQRAPAQDLPSRPCTEYHCRNCLNSEDPFRV